MQKEQAYYKELLWKFVNNELTPGQVEDLLQFINQNPDWYARAMAEPQISVMLEQLAHNTLVPDAMASRMRERLLKTIEKPAAPAVQGKPPGILVAGRFIKRGWWAAAIFIIALSTFVWLHKKESRTVETPVAQTRQEIPAGGYHALLTLANGQTIILDSNYGSIVQQGNFKVINQKGQLNYNGESEAMEYHTLTTPRGGQYRVELPDGTNVWLNAASSITYPTAFAANERRVSITGEVYFEVFKNKRKPFRVVIAPSPGKTEGAEVEVLGTHFNINAYNDEAFIKTTLLEGKVKIVNRQPATSNMQSAILQPGEQAIASSHSPLTVDHSPDIEQVMAWKNGFFNFENADLKTVVRQLSRWYDVDVIFEGTVPDRRFGGEIPMNLSLEEMLKALNKMEVKFRVQGRKLIVLP